jgi:hypothetical protein
LEMFSDVAAGQPAQQAAAMGGICFLETYEKPSVFTSNSAAVRQSRPFTFTQVSPCLYL